MAGVGWRWLALAGVGLFFTHKSHAAAIRACNAMIRNGQWLPSDIFDSHHPLHSQPSLAKGSQ
jgi:hypothetical protein